jgi:hypothetical protein
LFAISRKSTRAACAVRPTGSQRCSHRAPRHDKVVKLRVYERAGVREVWFIEPIERILIIHRLEAGHYGRATPLELKGQTPLTAVPGVTIDWDQVLAEISWKSA